MEKVQEIDVEETYNYLRTCLASFNLFYSFVIYKWNYLVIEIWNTKKMQKLINIPALTRSQDLVNMINQRPRFRPLEKLAILGENTSI